MLKFVITQMWTSFMEGTSVIHYKKSSKQPKTKRKDVVRFNRHLFYFSRSILLGSLLIVTKRKSSKVLFSTWLICAAGEPRNPTVNSLTFIAWKIFPFIMIDLFSEWYLWFNWFKATLQYSQSFVEQQHVLHGVQQNQGSHEEKQ